MKKIAPYGSWSSPISADQMAAKNIGFSFPRYFDGHLYWMEFRPHEQARTVIVRQTENGDSETLTPENFSVHTKAQEYGGCCYCVGGGFLFFVNARDQRVYRQNLEQTDLIDPVSASSDAGSTKATTTATEAQYHYADLIYDSQRERLIAVGELHSAELKEPITSLVSLSTTPYTPSEQTATLKTLAKGADFYSNPRLSPSGQQLLWLQWNHPDMPWDKSELWASDVDSQGSLFDSKKLSDDNESVFQPEWSPSGKIYYVSDRSNWWNLYEYSPQKPRAVLTNERECGLPLWQFGMSTWGFLDEDSVLVADCSGAEWQLSTIEIENGGQQILNTGDTGTFNYYTSIATDVNTGRAAVIAAGPKSSSCLCLIEKGHITIGVKSGDMGLSEADISAPTPISFPTSNSEKAYGYYYAPTHQTYEGSDNEKPPLIVLCHGGPTASTSAAFNLKVQFWTSRGFAVVDVNYRGSTGYGRAYRDKLKENWGVYDVDDACAAARYVVDQGLADADRLIIRGSSAGGYTVLSALCFRDIFAAGSSLYGIGDLNALISDTHKFESRYTDSLIAPPEQSEIYEARSPIYHIHKFNCPVVFFQGLKDKVVPPNQAELMVQALDDKDIPVAFVTYENEGHGFRNTENVVHAFNAELAFYGKIFGFQTDSNVENLEVRNLDAQDMREA